MMEPKRITTSPPGKWVGTEYSSINAWSCDQSHFVLLYIDHFGLHSADGTFLYDLPIGASGEPRWSRTDPSIIYHHSGNTMYEYNVATRNGGVLHQFDGYTEISGRGESDISRDSLPLFADGYVFQFNLALEVKGPSLSTRGFPVESLYAIDGMTIVSWGEKGTDRYRGIELFSPDMRFVRQLLPANAHKDVGYDVDGTPLLILTNSDDAGADPVCPNGIERIDLITGERRCLLPLDWSLAVHISGGIGFCIVETYSKPGSPPVPFQDAIIKLPYEPPDSAVYTRAIELCKHGSQITSYTAQPKATLSGDGTKVLFSSNREAPDRSDYCDVFLLDLAPQVVTQIPPTPVIPSPPGGSRTYGRGRGKIH